MDHAQGCTETSKVQNCFACLMESEKEKYGDSVQFFSGDTLTVEVTEDKKLRFKNPHEESYKTLGPEYWFNKVQYDMDQMPDEKKTHLSDGYHSFKELYDHRVKLFIALCNALAKIDTIKHYEGSDAEKPIFYRAWKAKKHADGTMWDGWFIAGIGTEKGETLTYHIPIEEWNNMNFPEVGHAPEWDGHTSDDVLILLSKL